LVSGQLFDQSNIFEHLHSTSFGIMPSVCRLWVDDITRLVYMSRANGYCCQPLTQADWQAVLCHMHIASCNTPHA